jgi:hypothetical protein
MIETMSRCRGFRRGGPTGALLTPFIPPMKTSVQELGASVRRGSFSVIAHGWIGEMMASAAGADHGSPQADERASGPLGGAGQSKGGLRHG